MDARDKSYGRLSNWYAERLPEGFDLSRVVCLKCEGIDNAVGKLMYPNEYDSVRKRENAFQRRLTLWLSSYYGASIAGFYRETAERYIKRNICAQGVYRGILPHLRALNGPKWVGGAARDVNVFAGELKTVIAHVLMSFYQAGNNCTRSAIGFVGGLDGHGIPLGLVEKEWLFQRLNPLLFAPTVYFDGDLIVCNTVEEANACLAFYDDRLRIKLNEQYFLGELSAQWDKLNRHGCRVVGKRNGYGNWKGKLAYQRQFAPLTLMHWRDGSEKKRK